MAAWHNTTIRILGACSIVLLIFAAEVKKADAEDWPRFRGPDLNGISTESNWNADWAENQPPIAWKTNVGLGMSGIVTSQGRLFTIGNDENVDTIHCLDAETGKEVWRFSYACATDPNEFDGGSTSTPTVDGQHVYTLSREGDVHCLDTKDGSVAWQVNVADQAEVRIPGWGFAGSPLIVGERLVLNVGDAGVALDKKTGELLWDSADKDAGYSSLVPIAMGSQRAVVFGSARSYVCVNLESGEELWRQRWLTTFGCNAADPVLLPGGDLFLSSGYNRGSARLTVRDGEPELVWKSKEMQNQLLSSVLVNTSIIGVHGDVDAGTELRCLDAESGDLLWSESTFQPGALSATGDSLLVLTQEGELIVGRASETGFKQTGRIQVLEGRSWTAPVLSNGKIFCRNSTGDLACVTLEVSK